MYNKLGTELNAALDFLATEGRSYNIKRCRADKCQLERVRVNVLNIVRHCSNLAKRTG